ncbi:hypothetical protein STRIP9103_01701 [Streptomyces ipomoeae 91-03]|uniref:Uncharacterized protein n=1 Tax=Streptomyces ipomoeae 91-03 TaxID=698759 RepID=L1KLF0_9ACTN|nr:hypothetical protein STRIP9103_01701 [Streptomyces ipomoeae 91-03]
MGDALLDQLRGGEAGSLEDGARLVGADELKTAPRVQPPDHPHHQVHGGRPGLADSGDRGAHLVGRPALALPPQQRERHPVRARRPDRRRTAYDEALDGGDQGVHIADLDRLGAMRKRGLVDEREAASGPVDGTQLLGHSGALLVFPRCPTPCMTSKNRREPLFEPRICSRPVSPPATPPTALAEASTSADLEAFAW